MMLQEAGAKMSQASAETDSDSFLSMFGIQRPASAAPRTHDGGNIGNGFSTPSDLSADEVSLVVCVRARACVCVCVYVYMCVCVCVYA